MRKLAYLVIILLPLLLVGCGGKKNNVGSQTRDLQQIKKGKELVVLTMNRSTSYFIYRGEEMGFQYELAQQFASSQGLTLKIKTAHNMKEMLDKLRKGEGDIVAFNVPYTKENKDSLLYCGEQIVTHQVLVQRKTGGSSPLTNVTQLVGKTVYVKPGRYLQRLENLNKELGGGIHIREVKTDSITTEDLIYQVSLGKIDYTVTDDEEALLNKTYFENLDVSLAVSFDQRSSWVVRKNCPQLAAAASKWYKDNVSTEQYKSSMQRYFDISKQRTGSHYKFTKKKLSPFDHLFKQYAKKIDWDWRLLAALAYKESTFDPKVVSWAGARGLMQLMPSTARKFGLPRGKDRNPEESIKAASKYIAFTERQFSDIKNKHVRLQFVLATYNAGYGHISDAMALASKYGKSRHVWTGNVEKFILLKSNEKYYDDPVCKNGYFRGMETYNFVRDVLEQYKAFKKKTKR
jgi:membrane-bound lytic murein transglycosylase F